tara:strand:+ start:229 stop:468 length:240 start_codon:yes stop_codon:yes gene_type:complete
VKIFWPYRSKAKGFSIENLADKYREKISSLSSDTTSNQFLDDRNLKSINIDSNHIERSPIVVKRVHWANRDFSEYKEVA